jgi:dihydroorotate dehydrogenase electron transfer subunit
LSSTGAESALPIRADAVVLENVCESGVNYRIVLEVCGWPGAAPGQFVMLSPGAQTGVSRSDPLLPRPMAVYRGHAPASETHGARVEVLYKATGRGTRLIAEARPGERLRVVGPLGEGFPPIHAGRRAILIGGGTGLASLYELAVRGVAAGAEVQLVLGARSIDELMGRADFEALGAGLEITTEDGSHGLHGRVTDALSPMLERAIDDRRTTLYVCGPTPMMRACAALAKTAGVRCLVSLENTMACGFGVCLGCAVPLAEGGFALLCQRGPVLDADAVAWEGLP